MLALLLAGRILALLLALLLTLARDISDSHIGVSADRRTNIIHGLDTALHNVASRIADGTNCVLRGHEKVMERAVDAGYNSTRATCLDHSVSILTGENILNIHENETALGRAAHICIAIRLKFRVERGEEFRNLTTGLLRKRRCLSFEDARNP